MGHNKGWEEAASNFTSKPVNLENSCAALLETKENEWEDALKSSDWSLKEIVDGAT